MSHVYVFSPSSAVRDKAAFRRGVQRLQALGHQVEVDAAALARQTRFAGDDTTRLAALARAAASGADVLLQSRGGYGLSRLLADIPYKKLARAVERGARLVGFSDFTALQCALLAKTGAISWSGPALGEDFGAAEGADDIMLACFDDVVSGRAEGSGWRLPRKEARSPEAALHLRGCTLWGGNLSVLVTLLGTPYWPAVERGVLFLEDVGEHPYRIERMLTQLLHTGVLARQKAVVLGAFNRYSAVPQDRGYTLRSAVDWLRAQLRVPVLTGLPTGHVATKVMLPIGARVDLLVQGRDALLLWPHEARDHD